MAQKMYTQAQLDAAVAKAVKLALADLKPAPVEKAKTLSDTDMKRKDGTKGKGENAGMVWWVKKDGTQRKWVTAESYAQIQRKRDIASGKVTITKRSQEEKDAYQAYYDAEWAKWKATGKRTSEQNRAKSAEIKAAWKAMNE